MGTCAAYGGVPAMRNNPTGAMGLGDYLGAGWRSQLGLPDRQPARLSGPAGQHHRDAAAGRAHLAGIGPEPTSTTRAVPLAVRANRPRRMRPRRVLRRRAFASEPGDGGQCLVKLGCRGPGRQVQRPRPRLDQRRRRLPQRRRHLHGLHDARLPRQFMPFLDADRLGRMAASPARFAYGPALKYLRARAIRRRYDVEPSWRRPSDRLERRLETSRSSAPLEVPSAV